MGTVEANFLDLAAVAQRPETIGFKLLTDRNARIANSVKVMFIDLTRSGNLAGMNTACRTTCHQAWIRVYLSGPLVLNY